jgi:hypothetical protein
MGRAKRPPPPTLGPEALGAHRVHGRRLQGLLLIHGRQDPGQGARQHALAGAGRTHQQEVVATARGDLERAFGVVLGLDVRQLRVLSVDRGHGRRGAGLHERLALHMGADLQQVLGWTRRALTRTASAALSHGTTSARPAFRTDRAEGTIPTHWPKCRALP